jgi:hypothetical protein
VDAQRRVVGIGEFSYRTRGAGGWSRIDRVAEGFDVAIVADAACTGLHLYGVDDAGQRFEALAPLPTCSRPPR